MRDRSLFELFVAQYQDLVFSTAVRLLQNQADAQDVAQEVFLRAFRDFDNLKDNPSAGGWLRCVARNLSLNHLTRYRSRWRLFSDFFHSDEQEGAGSLEDLISQDVNPEQPAEIHLLVREALLGLPSKQRVPLVLYHYEDMSYQEIADALHIRISQVKTDIHRGREALRVKIERLRRQAEGEQVSWPAPWFQPPIAREFWLSCPARSVSLSRVWSDAYSIAQTIMKNTDPQEPLEQFIDAALKELPDFKAPPQLLGNVMRNAEAGGIAWWQRGWSSWPLGMQIASALALGTLAMLTLRGLGHLLSDMIGSPWAVRTEELAGGLVVWVRSGHWAGPCKLYFLMGPACLLLLCLVAPVIVGAIRLVCSMTLERR